MGVCMRGKTLHPEGGCLPALMSRWIMKDACLHEGQNLHARRGGEGELLTCFDVAMDDAALMTLHEGQKNSTHVASHLHATKLIVAVFIGKARILHITIVTITTRFQSADQVCISTTLRELDKSVLTQTCRC
jgi:hypothetical protein